MSKMTGAPRGRDVFKDLERAKDVIEQAPPAPAPTHPSAPPILSDKQGWNVEIEAPEQPRLTVAGEAIANLLPKREAWQQMNIKVPKELYDDLRDYMKLTDTPMSHVLIEGGRKELAALKKKHGG